MKYVAIPRKTLSFYSALYELSSSEVQRENMIDSTRLDLSTQQYQRKTTFEILACLRFGIK